MQFKNIKLKEAEARLLPELVPYLKSKNVVFNNTGTKFICVNPAHDDHNPSCSIVPQSNGTIGHCFSCNISFSIVQAAHFIDNKPISGPAYINTIRELSDELGLPTPDINLTKEEEELVEIYRIYEDATYLIQTSTIDTIAPYFNERHWDSGVGYRYGIGFVNSYLEFITNMQRLGHTQEMLEKSGIARKVDPKNPHYIAPTIFDRDNIIYTIHDYQGTPVAFAARNVEYRPGSSTSKYINSATSPIYRKREILYGLHHSRTISIKQGLILVEGYGDWVTMFEAGIRNVAALCGTALTKDHLTLLTNLDITKLYLCLDNDNGGQLALERILDDILPECPQFEIYIVQLPEGQDPDDILKGISLEAAQTVWNNLPKHSAFQWRLRKFTSATSMEEVANKMIPIIVSNPNLINREKMARDLSEYTGIRFEAIIGQVDRLTKLEDFRDSEHLKAITNALVRDIQRNPRNIKEILGTYEGILDEQEKITEVDNIGISETYKAFNQMIENWKDRKDSIIGIRTGFSELDGAINGVQEGKVIGIGGKPNHGKSAFVSNIAYNIAAMNEDAIVIVHNTDDNRETFLARMIAIDQGLVINSITNPKNNFKIIKDGRILYDEAKKQQWYNGTRNIGNLLEKGKLVVKDSTHGTTLAYTESLIKYYKFNNPNKRIVVIFDNFHKATDHLGMEERLRFKYMSGYIKNMAEKYNISIICTVEYTKMDEGIVPDNSSISESGQMHYDMSVILHLYNQVKDIGKDRAKLIIDANADIPVPIVEIKVGKNKQGYFSESLFYRFTTDTGKYEEMPRKIVKERYFSKQTTQLSNLGSRNQ